MKYLLDFLSNGGSTSSSTSTKPPIASTSATTITPTKNRTRNSQRNVGQPRSPRTLKLSQEREEELKLIALEATANWMDPRLISFVSVTEMENNSAQHRAWEEFYKTLERIINEIRGHELAAPFLNKVKKAEAADYYKIITNPVDLGQILKRVQTYKDNAALTRDADSKSSKPHHKSKAYRQYQEDNKAKERELVSRNPVLPNGNPFVGAYYKTKKEFEEELDLVWENCLRYNTLPSHPLRKVAETLRTKCKQLLHHVQEPTILPVPSTKRKRKHIPILPPQPPNAPVRPDRDNQDDWTVMAKRKRVIEDDDDDDDDDIPLAKRQRKSGKGGDGEGKRKIVLTEDEDEEVKVKKRAEEEAKEKGKGGNENIKEGTERRDDGDESEKERKDREERERIKKVPLNKRPPNTRPTEEQILEGFGEWNAYERTVEGMSAFVQLENFKRRRVESEAIKVDQMGIGIDMAEIERNNKDRREKLVMKIAAIPFKNKFLVRERERDKKSQKIIAHSATSGSVSPQCSQLSLGHDSDSTKATTSREVPSPAAANGSMYLPNNVWTTTETPEIFGDVPELQNFGPSAWFLLPNLDGLTRSGLPEVPFRNCKIDEEGEEEERKRRIKEEGLEMIDQTGGLLEKVKSNVEVLDRIRKLHSRIGLFKTTNDPRHLTREEPQKEEEPDLDIPPEAFSSCIAEHAAKVAIQQTVARLCQHAGFDAANKSALDIICSMTMDYMNNVGKTMRLYADSYGGKMPDEDILLHTLKHNGISETSSLHQYVTDDIEKYGTKLRDTRARLEKATTQLLTGYEAAQVIGDDRFFNRDGEAFVTGDFMYDIGEDFFGIADLGLDLDLGGKMRLDIPTALFRGDGKRTDKDGNDFRTVMHARTRFRKPPPFVPLDDKAIECQIGPLQSILQERIRTEKGLKEDDKTLVGKARLFRAKVPPGGKIPIKKKPEQKLTAKVKKTRVQALKAEAAPTVKKKGKMKGKELIKMPVVLEVMEPAES